MQVTYELSQIDEVARKILKKSSGRIILFKGELGAGKTTLIKSLVRQLGYEDAISSPTYSLVNEYEDAAGNPIYHFDFYRLKDETEALDMGVEEYFDSKNWIFIEWPEKINSYLPDNVHTATIRSTNGKTRILEFE